MSICTNIQCTIALLALAVVVGCASGPAEPGSASDSLRTIEAAQGLAIVEATQWRNAPAGCEGRLSDVDGDESFAVTRPDHLVAVLATGDILCVDTFASLELELDTIADESLAAETLRTRYFASLEGIMPTSTNAGGVPDDDPELGEPDGRDDPADEPHPQPSRPGSSAPAEDPPSDPHPQPSHPTQGDPHPQPSTPPTPDGTSNPLPTEMGAAPVLGAVADTSSDSD